jgi:hypothetical protein
MKKIFQVTTVTPLFLGYLIALPNIFRNASFMKKSLEMTIGTIISWLFDYPSLIFFGMLVL